MKFNKTKWYVWSNPGTRTFKNVQVEVTVKKTSSAADASFGVICNYVDKDNYYYTGVDANGFYAIVKYKGQKDNFLTGGGKWAKSSKIALKANEYNISAECINGSISLYVDGALIETVKDSGLLERQRRHFRLEQRHRHRRNSLRRLLRESSSVSPSDPSGFTNPKGLSRVMPVLSLREAITLRENLRTQNRKLVFTNGVFDLLHVGHLDYLEKARSLGDSLFVGINGDEAARRLKSGDQPFVPAVERARLVSALSCVDAAIIFDESPRSA